MHDVRRDNALWQQCWRDKQTAGFHQTAVNRHLIRFWSQLGLPAGARVFVPLCGKSMDLWWLAQQGHEVVGVELSPIAVRAFFREHRLKPLRSRQGRFERWRAGRITLLCGDFFDLTPADIGEISAVFDRASLTALPEDLRGDYLAHLERVVPPACPTFLLTTEDTPAGSLADGECYPDGEISALYAPGFEIELAHVESVFEANPLDAELDALRVELKVYVMRPHLAA